MKNNNPIVQFAILLLTASAACGQVTFIYDQQTSTNDSGIFIGGAYINNVNGPAQSFTPSLSAVGFVRLFISDNNAQDLLGTILVVNLRSSSMSGPILASTAPVALPTGWAAIVNFVFDNPAPVIPGDTYYFDIMRLDGVDTWTANINFYNYAGGTLFLAGTPDPSNRDMWFREGIYVVPEPSSAAVFLIGSGLISWRLRKPRRKA